MLLPAANSSAQRSYLRYICRSASTSTKVVLVFFVLLSVVFQFNDNNFIEARTSSVLKVNLSHGGTLVGRHLTTHNGRAMRAFLGVPYAKPPLGELRFKPPVPFGGWLGEKLAVQDSDKCTQRDPFRRDMEMEGSEDCLYLNVYTPQEPKLKEPLPVMVWFHGGGWECGAGISSYYGPDFILDHDVVLVSANFRLGPLGFLSTETLDCPGNFGLKDQVEVLNWVQRNIAAFGGNRDSVTLFGESAGGASITYHMISAKSKGLFHKAIAQSGTYFNPWAQPAHKGVAAKRALKTAQLVGCSSNDVSEDVSNWSNILSCLRQKKADDIVATIYDLFEWDFDPMIPFPPVVEPKHSDAFLTQLPRSVEIPHGLSLPLLLGATSEEGVIKTAPILNLPNLLTEFKAKFRNVLPIVLNYDHHSNDVQQKITDKIENFYFPNGHDYDRTNHQNFTDLISDGWFISGIDEYLRLRLKAQHTGQNVGPTYVYLFDHKGAASFSEVFQGGRDEYYGTSHAEELQYLFPIGQALFVSAVPTKSDLRLREIMLQMWINFVYHSNPNPRKNTELPDWVATKTYPVTYARIGNKNETNPKLLRIEKSLFQHRVDFWHDLKPHVPAQQYQQRDEL